jgi:hypothetical protein
LKKLRNSVKANKKAHSLSGTVLFFAKVPFEVFFSAVLSFFFRGLAIGPVLVVQIIEFLPRTR